MDINSQHHNLLGNQILPKSEDFCILTATIANQNGRHMVQHVLLPVNIHFHWNIFIFEFLTIYFYFFLFLYWQPLLNGGHFVLSILIFLAYLVPLDVDVTGNITAKICDVWSEFNIFSTLVTMATATILNFFNPQKLPHTFSCFSIFGHFGRFHGNGSNFEKINP